MSRNRLTGARCGLLLATAVASLGLAGGAPMAQAAEPELISTRRPHAGAAAEVKAAIEAFRSAVNRGDSAAFFELLATDLEVFAPGARPIRGAAARESFRPWFTELRVQMAPFTDEEITVSGDLAMQRHSFRLTTTPRSGGDGATTVAGSGLHMWRRTPGGRWQLVKDIWTVPAGDGADR